MQVSISSRLILVDIWVWEYYWFNREKERKNQREREYWLRFVLSIFWNLKGTSLTLKCHHEAAVGSCALDEVKQSGSKIVTKRKDCLLRRTRVMWRVWSLYWKALAEWDGAGPTHSWLVRLFSSFCLSSSVRANGEKTHVSTPNQLYSVCEACNC